MQFTKNNIKLFVLSGKAKSGKNEVAKIIENYYKEKKCITISFAYYLKDYVKRITNWDGSEDIKPRKLLQELGIELIKEKIDSKLLINRVLQDIEVFSYFYDIIIISDARLVDEIEAIKRNYNDSISIRISRNNINNGLSDDEKNHITEIGLNDYNNFDYYIENNDIKNLEDQVENILRMV